MPHLTADTSPFMYLGLITFEPEGADAECYSGTSAPAASPLTEKRPLPLHPFDCLLISLPQLFEIALY